MEAAEEFVNDWTFEDFASYRKTQFAVIRALEIVGEATKNIPYEIHNSQKEIITLGNSLKRTSR